MKLFKNKLAVTVSVLSVSFLILIAYSVKRENTSFLENGVGLSLNSVQSGVYKTISATKNWFSFISHFSEVKTENEELKRKNAEMEGKVLEYDSLKKENDDLKKMYEFTNSHQQYDYLGCSIIGKSGNDILDGFIINKGKKDGVSNGMAVISSDGLIGQVTSVGDSWSKVQSLANENIAVSAEDTSTQDNSGIVKGYRDSNNRQLAKLYNLPLNSQIKIGDQIVTSGLGGIYPKDIKIGTVLSIEEDRGKIMTNAVIQPYVDFNKLEEVFVVLPKNKDEIKY